MSAIWELKPRKNDQDKQKSQFKLSQFCLESWIALSKGEATVKHPELGHRHSEVMPK